MLSRPPAAGDSYVTAGGESGRAEGLLGRLCQHRRKKIQQTVQKTPSLAPDSGVHYGSGVHGTRLRKLRCRPAFVRTAVLERRPAQHFRWREIDRTAFVTTLEAMSRV